MSTTASAHPMTQGLKEVLDRDGSIVGIPTGGSYNCAMESCRGLRIGVRWPDGKITFPCSRGLKWNTDSQAQIE